MKLKVRPEGRAEVYLVEADDLKKWMKKQHFKMVHNFIPVGNINIGADWPVADVYTAIDKAERMAITTGRSQAGNFGHALAVVLENRLMLYDIGKITEEDLDINEAETNNEPLD